MIIKKTLLIDKLGFTNYQANQIIKLNFGNIATKKLQLIVDNFPNSELAKILIPIINIKNTKKHTDKITKMIDSLSDDEKANLLNYLSPTPNIDNTTTPITNTNNTNNTNNIDTTPIVTNTTTNNNTINTNTKKNTFANFPYELSSTKLTIFDPADHNNILNEYTLNKTQFELLESDAYELIDYLQPYLDDTSNLYYSQDKSTWIQNNQPIDKYPYKYNI